MRADTVQDRQHYAWGVAARHVGVSADVYRPSGPGGPINDAHRFLRFNAAFLPAEGGMNRPGGYGQPEWQGIFDASYTRPGDYVVTADRTFFIAAQQPLLPVLCVLTNRTVSIGRPSLQTSVGTNGYGGYNSGTVSSLLIGWPVSMLGTSASGVPATGLPTAQSAAQVMVLLPVAPSINLMPGDMISDDLGRNLMVTSAELSELGWRLSARVVTP